MLAIEPPCVFDGVAYLFLCCAIRIAVLAWQFVAESMRCGVVRLKFMAHKCAFRCIYVA